MRSDSFKRLAAVVFCAAVLAGGYYGIKAILAPQRFGQGDNIGAPGLPPGVGLRVDRLSFTGYDAQNRPVYKLRADVVDAGSDRMRVEARGNVEAELLDAATGKRRAFVVAPNAVFSRASNTLQVGGKIVARFPGDKTATDIRVNAETLLWNVGTKQVLCSGAVHLDLPNASGTADGRNVSVNLETRVWTAERLRGEFVIQTGAGENPPAFVPALPKF
ncbi:MAG: hypothetical protein H7Y38_16305 [Armatimonadetes bacterium]|nr:hypothetical protein [Armatimonadota bacterium]